MTVSLTMNLEDTSLTGQMALWRKGLGVRRYHMHPTIGEQTVGHHTAGVCLIIILCHPAPSVLLLKAALFHDLAEGQHGDMPGQVLWANARLAAAWEEMASQVDKDLGLQVPLPVEEAACLKVADTLELLLWSAEQMRLGNTEYFTVFKRGADFLHTFPHWHHVPDKFALLYTELHNLHLGHLSHLEFSHGKP